MGKSIEVDTLSGFLPTITQASGETDRTIDRVLHAVRAHLRMDVAFISEFIGKERVFRHLDAEGRTPISVGDTLPLEAGYCQRVVDGRLPRLIADTCEVPEAMAQPETYAVPIGSHMSVPIRLADGRLYGTFCCFGFKPDQSLNERDLGVMEAFAEIIAGQLDIDAEAQYMHKQKHERVSSVIELGGPSIHFQPISRLSDNRIVGVECLARFHGEVHYPPDIWFADAAEVGLGVTLEICAICKALAALDVLPDSLYLAVNASPATILSNGFERIFDGLPVERIVLELTEHALVDDYAALQHVTQRLRMRGLRISIDDAGAGYSSLRHILNLQPDIIKLDMSLTRNIDTDPARRALAAALIEFARQTRSSILAEGVETPGELDMLRELGAAKAQGYFLSRPLSLSDAVLRLGNGAAH